MGTQVAIGGGEICKVPGLTARAWFAVHTCSRHEKQVALQMAARGIQHLLPVYAEAHRWADRRAKVEIPLFPGYLFVNIVRGQRMDVLRVPGVARIVGFNGTPVPVRDDEILALRNAIRSGLRIEPHPFLKMGRRVRVRTGALRGVEGILVRKKDRERVVVSVDLIMKSVALEIDAADLEVIS